MKKELTEPRAWFTVDELNAWADKKLKENPQWAETPAQQDIPDLIAGALGVSRGTAYDMMREALAEAQQQEGLKMKMSALELILHLAEGSTTLNTLQHITKIARGTLDALKEQEEMQPFKDMTNESYLRGVRDGRMAAQTTSPPASKPWVGLTDEEIHKMTVLMGINPEWKTEMEIVRSVVRNLEAKLREKNA